MLTLIVSLVLWVLGVVLVVLTRMRLAKPNEPGAGNLDIPLNLVNVHTITGALGLLLFGAYMVVHAGPVVGVIGLVLWWIATVIGLLLLARWLPARGRHASDGFSDSWTNGPWLSMVGHLGAVVGAIAWTTFFALGSLA